MKDVRSNKVIESAVSRGLAVAMLDGVLAGIELMQKEHVPVEVIARVIFTPENRRSTDWHH